MAHGAVASQRDFDRELAQQGLDGYASDTEFNSAFVDEPFQRTLDHVLVVENLPLVPTEKLGK